MDCQEDPLSDWLLTPQRAAIHLPTATAVIADLHLGYDLARQRSGEAVPDGDVESALAGLQQLTLQHTVSRLVVAGDLFEDGRQGEIVCDQFLRFLAETRLELIGVIPGNHDRGLPGLERLPVCPDGVELGRWRVVHGHEAEPAGRIVQGHVHPCVRWRGRAWPCFLASGNQLVLPAFSADAAGVDIRRDPVWNGYRVWVIAGGQVREQRGIPSARSQPS
jgi:putative SbcD/Mre11-related phosphoesterase